MKLSTNFQKDPWLRRVHPDNSEARFALGYRPYVNTSREDSYVQLFASDFLNELSPAAHPINSRYQSTRPIWKPTGEKDANGKEKWEIDGYDELESVALGWQQFICGNKVAHLTGNHPSLAKEMKGADDDYDELLSLLDAAGIPDAWTEIVFYSEREGDSGILLTQTPDGEIEWEVYAYEKGHTIYPQIDENGKPVYYITYMKAGKKMCDVISTKYIEKWVMADPKEEENLDFFEKLWKRLVPPPNEERTEDGYVLVYRKEAQAGNDLCQFIYFRVPDVSWGPAELAIEAHENAASYVANEVKDSAFPLLVLKAEKTTSLPPSEMNGKTIAIKGTADALAHSDVKFESPADASNIATIHFKELNENIMRATQSVIISPDILKQGSDSSTSIKILFRPEIEWARQRWIYYNKPYKYLIKVFKRLAGKAEGKIDKYDKIRTSVWFEPWIPQNLKEETDIVTAKVYARLMSRKAAQNELGSPYRGDYEVINNEWAEEIRMKAEIPAEVQAKYGTSGAVEPEDNPDKPDIDNNDKGKSIAER